MAWNTKDGSPASYEEEDNVDFTQPVIGGPVERGFDYFFGTAGCSTSDPPYCFIENDKTISIPRVMTPKEMYERPGVVKGLMASDWSQEEVDVRLTEKAIDFIDKHQSDEGPRGDLVALVDWSVGEISKTLKKYGLDENTLIIVTSDNGPRKGANGHKSAGDYRGYKSQIWDGGHRVPFIASWPGMIEPKTQSDEVFSLSDMMATFAALFEVELPANTAEDSYNVLPALLGQPMANNKMRPRVFHSDRAETKPSRIHC